MNIPKDDFEKMLEDWGDCTQKFFCVYEENQFFLANKNERIIMEIRNDEVIKFLRRVIYGNFVTMDFIESFSTVGAFYKRVYTGKD